MLSLQPAQGKPSSPPATSCPPPRPPAPHWRPRNPVGCGLLGRLFFLVGALNLAVAGQYVSPYDPHEGPSITGWRVECWESSLQPVVLNTINYFLQDSICHLTILMKDLPSLDGGHNAGNLCFNQLFFTQYFRIPTTFGGQPSMQTVWPRILLENLNSLDEKDKLPKMAGTNIKVLSAQRKKKRRT